MAKRYKHPTTDGSEQASNRPFDPGRVPSSQRLANLVADVAGQLQRFESIKGGRVRRRKAKDQLTFDHTVSALICDVVHRTLTSSAGGIAVPLSKQRLNGKYKAQSIAFNRQLPAMVKALATPDLAFLELDLGKHTPFGGIRSTICAGQRLRSRIAVHGITLDDFGRSAPVSGDSIVLRATRAPGTKASKKLPLPDAPEVPALIADMKVINDWLANANVAYEGKDRSGVAVDDNDRFLRRIFNNGSLGEGGRLFGGFWQQLSKTSRAKSIWIDDEVVVERDFGQMAMRIAYSMVGATPPSGDLYELPGFKGSRNGIKRVTNAILANHKQPGRFPQGTKELFPRGTDFGHVLEAIKAAHRPIVGLMGTSLAGKLQRTESDILVRVLLRLIRDGVTALPIHDCLVIPSGAVEEVDAAMLSEFKALTGIDGVIG